MDTSKLKTYAPKARREFIAAVTRRAAKFGITAKGVSPVREEGQLVIIEGEPYPRAVAAQRIKLVARIEQHGFHQVMEAAAYTWFNRFAAIRFMELHGYLDHSFRVLSHPAGSALPEILEHAQNVDLPGLDRERVVDLKMDGTRDEELYRDLLLAQCHALHQAMPFLFERVDDESELLLPDNLLQTDSLIRELVTAIPEEEWQEIEIIGWLYQFYISEKKDQVIGKVVASVDIPAATQLFTPNWIVKYMVQNSLGAQWLATYPQSPLKAQMEYYIEPAEQTDEVKAQLAAITPSQLNPEELTLIDPACGSGHILVEAYELFKAIYLERGYRQRELPQLILEKNLFGLDIDERAAQLTGFALMMKGRADDRRLFERGVKLNVMALVDSAGFDAEGLAKGVELSDYGLEPGDLRELKRLFEHATTFGSLIQVPEELAKKLPRMKQLSEATKQDLFVLEALKRLGPLVQQAELLAARYDEVVANPPYMGSGGMNATVKMFAKDYFPDAKSDLFACFIERGYGLSNTVGHNAMVTMESWMFLSGYESFRSSVLRQHTVRNLAHFPYDGKRPTAMGINFGIAVVSAQSTPIPGYRGHYCCSRYFELRADGVPLEFPTPNERLNTVSSMEFAKIPGSPVAYWVSDTVRQAFETGDSLENHFDTRLGMSTANNDAFVRNWCEVAHAGIHFDAESREVALEEGRRWFPYQKGGPFRKWYGNNWLVVDWENDGARIRSFGAETGKVRSHNYNLDYVFRQGITWTDVTSARNAFRWMDEGYLFDGRGSSGFSRAGLPTGLILALLNTEFCFQLLRVINPTLTVNVNEIQKLPVNSSVQRRSIELSRDAKKCVEHARADWNAYERSWDFQSLPLLTASSDSTPILESSYTAWIAQNRDTIAKMKRLEEENNRLFIDAYGLADELTPDVPIEQITLTVNPAYRYGGKLTEEELWTRFREDTMQELVSYAIGCMMGRYSLDKPGLILANAGDTLAEYDHILADWHETLSRSPIDIFSTALNKNAEINCFSCGTSLSCDETRFVLARYEDGKLAGRPLLYCESCAEEKKQEISKAIPLREFNYSNAIREKWFEPETGASFLELAGCFNVRPAPEPPCRASFRPDDDGIIPFTDTEWFDDDAANRLVEFISVAWDSSHLEENLTFLADNLAPRKGESSSETLRRYLCDSFFKDHLQTYKKRPIYWLFSSGKQKAFQCLVYLHRYSEGTLARMRMEYVVPLQGKMAARIDKLADDVQAASTSAQAKRLQKERDKLTRQLEELRRYDEQLRHYADLRISLDLDDGVKINYGKFGDLLAEVKAITGRKG